MTSRKTTKVVITTSSPLSTKYSRKKTTSTGASSSQSAKTKKTEATTKSITVTKDDIKSNTLKIVTTSKGKDHVETVVPPKKSKDNKGILYYCFTFYLELQASIPHFSWRISLGKTRIFLTSQHIAFLCPRFRIFDIDVTKDHG